MDLGSPFREVLLCVIWSGSYGGYVAIVCYMYKVFALFHMVIVVSDMGM